MECGPADRDPVEPGWLRGNPRMHSGFPDLSETAGLPAGAKELAAGPVLHSKRQAGHGCTEMELRMGPPGCTRNIRIHFPPPLFVRGR